MIESGKHSQRGSIPAQRQPRPPAPRRPLIGPLIIPPLADWTGAKTPLMPVRPSLQHFQQRRGEILHRSGLNDSTVRPFRGRRRPALLDVLTCYIKQINNQEESYCLMWSRLKKKKTLNCKVQL